MFTNLKNRLLNGWNAMRFVRLGLASLVIVEAFKNSELIFGALGTVLFLQAAFNYGCCATFGCGVSPVSRNPGSPTDQVKDISFEEVK